MTACSMNTVFSLHQHLHTRSIERQPPPGVADPSHVPL